MNTGGNKNLFRYNAQLFLFTAAILALTSCTRISNVAEIVHIEPEGVKKPVTERQLTQLERWEALVRENRYAAVDQKLVLVNEFFNRLDYIEDRYLWGREDYWATLPETLEMSGGDCEDVTIAKFFTLLWMDIPGENLRITYVISLNNSRPHMVLTFYKDLAHEPIILDTMNNYLFPASKRPDLVPVYSFNAEGYWLSKKGENWQGDLLGSSERLSMWREVLERMRTDKRLISGG